jgi:hypothetical protein
MVSAAPLSLRESPAVSHLSPLFIFALPRSGSTLLQRILAAHESVVTTAEPHVLLPLLAPLRGNGAYAEYRQAEVAGAIDDFCRALPHGVEDYHAAVRDFAMRLYRHLANGDHRARYFLDKTPAYHFIVDEILRAFPAAKCIFLWRNPLAVAASCMESWNAGRWNLYRHKVDHFQGLARLIAAFEANASRACAVRYEDLLQHPERETRRLCDYLGLTYDATMIERFDQVKLTGFYSDRTGAARYHRIDREPLEKWKREMCNPIRAAWCRRYIRWIGQRRLAVMGYDEAQLLREINSLPQSMHLLASDALRVPYGFLYCALELQIVKDKLGMLPDWSRVVPLF